ncbi:hypothetical protein SAMN02745121_03749 [Nannocystis exedens]|uniref:Lipoprotein n=1 Tax=Nannocystis exedens TaxID=54 RepID=A0A1I1ZC92_9BACT|nr:DUF6263 family protein [Nannocystis exedens]PCC75046.1 hypothetical protein NAEX_08149 [Nannocystis exedens]SFE29327.1 hypothetical protein SAMN02745121_03749 [Nannocystis exedens]
MSLRPRLRALCVPLAAAALHLFGCQPEGSKTDAKPAAKTEAAPTKTDAPPPAPVAAAPAAEPATPAVAPDAAATAGNGSVVTLIEAGAEPREPLRLKLTAGQEQAMVMTMRMGMAMQVGPNAMPKTDIPPLQMTMNLKVAEITGEGDIRSEFSLAKIEVLPDPKVPAAMVDQLKTVLGTMNKMSGTSLMTPRGIVKSADFDLPADVNPQLKQTVESMRQQINQMSVPFPEEALGVGAKWTVTQQLEQQGMKLEQVATWELKGREGSVVKLASTIVQTAAPQTITAPGMPPGATVSLDRLDSSGTGTTEVDLTHVAPIKGDMSLKSSLAMTTDANGMKMPMTMDMDMNLQISGK